MRPKTVILLVVAVVCGLVASIGVSQYMEKARGGGTTVASAKIFVATTEIGINEKLDAKNIRLEEWPRDRVPEGAVTDLKLVEGKFTRARLYKGEPILTVKVTDSTGGNPEKTIEEGMRVVAIKVNVDQVAGGLIRPGDRVDVVVFLRKSSEVPETKTMTILRDVSVFAVDADTEREVEKQGGRDMRTVSLLVSAKQAETVILVKDLGQLSLTLRNPGDRTEGSGDGESIRDLLGSDGENANQKKKDTKSDNEAGIAQFLAKTAADIAPPPPVAPPVIVPEDPPKFVQVIRTPNGDRQYRYKDLDGKPEEYVANASPAAPPQLVVPVTPVAMPVITPPKPVAQEPKSLPAMDEIPGPSQTNQDAKSTDVNQDENPPSTDGP